MISGLLEGDLVRAAVFPVMLVGTFLIWRAGRHVAGRLLVLIGALHLTGLWVGRGTIRSMIAGGLFNQAESALAEIPGKVNQELVFWFALWGVMMIVFGQAVIFLERRGVEPPAWFGWQLIAVSLACGFLMPKDGFWWVLLPAWFIVRRGATGSVR